MPLASLSDPAKAAEIRGRIARLRPDSPRQWGRMTPQQMMCHLTDSYLSVMGLRGTPPVSQRSRIIKWLALYLPLPWMKGVPTRDEVDQEKGGTAPSTDFEADRRKLLAVLDRYTASTRDFSFREHPIFGAMS
ncbi:MAG: hypothetical protein JNL98_35525, partial [Bryobacterales bacterium]|nr:hypothetical protein [Bryobacterales bacterium]